MIKFRFKTNHKYTTPGMTEKIEDSLRHAKLDSSYIAEGEPYSDLSSAGKVASLKIPHGAPFKGGWYFHLNDIILVKRKPTIIIGE